MSRDDRDTIYEALSEGFKERLGVDRMKMELAWPKIKESTPGIHIADQATVTSVGGDERSAQFELGLPMTRIRVRLVRQAYHSVRSMDEGRIEDDGEVIPRLDRVVRIDKHKITVTFETSYPIDMADLIDIRVGREWKIDGFEIVD